MKRDTTSTLSPNEHQEAGQQEEEREQSRWTWIVPLALLLLLVRLYFVWPGYQNFIGRAFIRPLA